MIVVDNASEDGSAAFVRERFPSVRTLALPVNAGYGAAANEGIEAAQGRLVLVMNADAWPDGDGDLERLIEFVEAHDDVGVATPLLVGLDGRSREAAVGFPSKWWLGSSAMSSSPRGLVARASGGLRDRLTRSDGAGEAAVVGAVLLLRRDALSAVGSFDPAYFMYYEDVDLCWRMLRGGWRVEVCRDARFVHVGGASTSRAPAAMYREQLRSHLRFLATHRGAADAAQARRLLVWTLRARGRLLPGARRASDREIARWLASASLSALLAEDPRADAGEVLQSA